jgi:hypothetical protein
MVAKKNSKAVQKMIPHTGQHLLPVGRLGKKTGNGNGARHRTKNGEKVSLPLCYGKSRHEFHPPIRAPFHHSGNSFSNTEFGARNLRRQRRNGAACVGMITVLG